MSYPEMKPNAALAEINNFLMQQRLKVHLNLMQDWVSQYFAVITNIVTDTEATAHWWLVFYMGRHWANTPLHDFFLRMWEIVVSEL